MAASLIRKADFRTRRCWRECCLGTTDGGRPCRTITIRSTPSALARLRASKIPVIAFASTNISAQWPAMVAESAAATGSTEVTVKRLDGWGHLDVICGTHAESEVYAPLLAWLRRHQK